MYTIYKRQSTLDIKNTLEIVLQPINKARLTYNKVYHTSDKVQKTPDITVDIVQSTADKFIRQQ